jgi:hypothetical protein
LEEQKLACAQAQMSLLQQQLKSFCGGMWFLLLVALVAAQQQQQRDKNIAHLTPSRHSHHPICSQPGRRRAPKTLVMVSIKVALRQLRSEGNMVGGGGWLVGGWWLMCEVVGALQCCVVIL